MNDFRQISELYHHGIKDQKWGIRRWQNYDGTLTEEGRARYNKGAKDKSDGTGLHYDESKNEKYYVDKKGNKITYKTRTSQLSKEDLADLNTQIKLEKTMIKEYEEAWEPQGPKADQALRDASKLAKDISDALPKGNGKVIKKDYSNLSDQELRNRINRLQLEDNYGKLTGDTKYIKSGSEKARELLQTAGAVLAIAGTAAALADTIFKIRESKRSQVNHSDILQDNELEHHGILGMKWGIRRYQNSDGTLTIEGRARYGGKTHVDELDDQELADLRDIDNKFKRNVALGAGITAAAAITFGAAYIARRNNQKTSELQNTNVQSKPLTDVLKKTGETKILALPAPAPAPASRKQYVKPNIADIVTKKKETQPIPSIPKKAYSKPEIHFGGMAKKSVGYDHRDVGPGVWYNDKRKYSKYEYFKDSRGVNHKILKEELRKVPRIHINHADFTDFAIFRDLYLERIDSLCHHGVKGQKWGVRRYQDYDGTLTTEGKRRYRTDQGTREIMENTSSYNSLIKTKKREYAEYGRTSGAKRGFIAGLTGGALLGVGKTALELAFTKPTKSLDGTLSYNNPSARSIVNRFTRNAMLGALGGSVIGTLIGSSAGKKSAQAELADKGRGYLDTLLAEPEKRLRGR